MGDSSVDMETMLDQSAPAHRFDSVGQSQFRTLSTLTEAVASGRRRRTRIQAGIAAIALLLIGGSGAALAATRSAPAVYTGTLPRGDGKVVFTVENKRVSCAATFFVTSTRTTQHDDPSVTAARAYVRHVDLQRILRSPAFADAARLEQQPAVTKIPVSFSSTLAAQQRALHDRVDSGVETALEQADLPLSVSVRPVFECATPES